jgi:hypothetical protein
MRSRCKYNKQLDRERKLAMKIKANQQLYKGISIAIATATTSIAGGLYGYLESSFLNKEGKFFGF